MSGTPNRRALLLDLAAVIGWAGPALMVVASLDRRPGWASAAVSSLLIGSMAVWVLWRRSGQRSRAAAIAFATIATVTMAFGNGSLYYGIVWAACLVLGVTFTAAAVVWGYAAALVGLVVALHLSAGSAPELMIGEAAVAAVFAGVAAAVAAILRDSFRVGEELRAALVQLDAVNAELRSRLDTDRDLALARERERTARELHDGLGHRLTAIGMSLDYADRVGDSPAAREETRRARQLVGESLDAMRRLVRAMHPVELTTLRNAEAFRAVAEAFRGTGIDIRVSIEGDDSALSHEHALLLLSFVQEGLTNVVRHSDAASVDLRMVVGAADLSAVIEDDGAGASTGPLIEGFGLRSLRARAERIGGAFTAERTPTGFRVALELRPALIRGLA
ncbi:sensor histidine kinase [Microbacterium sp. Kw_RZR3]|uniref:sensor histidine kinase n=1 Tax=Microbacterium sp. Kw_RZR3 TaxID=3032903 RepID=UPI0023DB15E2|nr:sensor histidine kinase [Microbacterium sp. Kw_RZR3]MDF2046408.1 sensor histidine kinase [Microbacterium sp. Kw_RZR3]